MKNLRKYAGVFYYILGVLFISGIILFSNEMVGVPDQVLTTILICFLFVFILFIPLFKKFKFQVFLFLLALTTGFYGFKYLSIEEYSFMNAIYSSFRLFIFDVDNVFSKSGDKFVSYPLAIEIARWSAAMYTISTLFQIIYKLFGQSMKLLWYQMLGNHIVISGINPYSKILIENLRKQRKPIVLLVEDISEVQKDYIKELGVILFVGKHGDHQLFKKSKLKRAKHFIVFHEDDSQNLNELLSIQEFFHDDRNQPNSLQVILHLTHRQSYLLYEDLEFDLKHGTDSSVNFSIKTFNVHRLMAEKLLNDHPLYLNYEDRVKKYDSDPLHLLFIGFGQSGQQVAIQAMERSHFIHQKQLHITILDKDAIKVEKEWHRNYPFSSKTANLNFHVFDIRVDSLDEFIQLESQPFTHAFICLNNDYLDMTEGINLTRKLPDIPIYIKMIEEVKISRWIHVNSNRYQQLYQFGNYESLLNENYVINNEFELLAKKIHEKYQINAQQLLKSNHNHVKLVENWDMLSDFMKESNRNQLNHAFTKLMLLGLDAVPKKTPLKDHTVILTKEAFLHEINNRLEWVAAAEHNRWNAFYFLRGWDVYLHVTKEKVKDEDKKLHGCLVPYDDLTSIHQLREIDYQSYDRKTVQNLYEIMDLLDYYIVKYI
ncbi:NAD-binding protein [Chengkuizengella axinellae]|uniref:RCK N-terminal domain-containing protein n=1 Tax=Chengkuizengella axinellae TaxID=3064388 RepID=A0ABT9J0M7_9BACL|nr:NAD-binding protein [Chengkuizengella sp. 2205SS18-9]MDP5274967.1 hypothetical protein [Chengkuizengella sp. 2205SS18-9]